MPKKVVEAVYQGCHAVRERGQRESTEAASVAKWINASRGYALHSLVS
jgi:hypothetical protein